jgi:hypothetical protein
MSVQHAIGAALDAAATFVERRVPWRALWASRLLGCTVGLLRLVGWLIDSPNAEVVVGHDQSAGLVFGPNRWRNRARLALAMWCGRYWYEWRPE